MKFDILCEELHDFGDIVMDTITLAGLMMRFYLDQTNMNPERAIGFYIVAFEVITTQTNHATIARRHAYGRRSNTQTDKRIRPRTR